MGGIGHGKNPGLALVCRALLSKVLTQLSADGWGSTPSLVVVWPEVTQPWGLGLCGRLMVNFKRIYAKGDLSVPHYHGPIHASREGPPTLAGRFGSVSYRVTAPLFWVLVHAKFCLCPPRLESLFLPVLWKSYNQILLDSRPDSLEIPSPFVRCPGW